jgi:hypothetical protein
MGRMGMRLIFPHLGIMSYKTLVMNGLLWGFWIPIESP